MSKRLDPSRTGPVQPRGRSGFTLTELIVVIGISVLLLGILIPTINQILKRATEQSTEATLNSIAAALDSYRSDYGDVPRFRAASSNMGSADYDPLIVAEDRGARLLARALTGVAPKHDDNAMSMDEEYRFMDGVGDIFDGEQPFGYATRRSNTGNADDTDDDVIQGVGITYLDHERFNLRRRADMSTLPIEYVYGPDAVFLDGNDRVIFYYPERAGRTVISDDDRFVVGNNLFSNTSDDRQTSLYNARDNLDADGNESLAERQDQFLTVEQLQTLLGDLDNNGSIGPGETAATEGPFLLIATGSSGTYLDAVANFETNELPRP